MACGRDQSSNDLLRELHWLLVKQRIIYKLIIYVYKALNDMAPLPWHISRTRILLNIGKDCDPLQIRPGWLFPDLPNVPVTWALLPLLFTSGMNFLFLFIYVNRSLCLCSRGSWKLTCFHNLFSVFHLFSFVKRSVLRGALYKCFGNNNYDKKFRCTIST